MPPTHGGYSLVVEPRFVEPIARVRFSLAALVVKVPERGFLRRGWLEAHLFFV